MAARERESAPVENCQKQHAVQPQFIQDDSQCGDSISSGSESSNGDSIYNAHIATGSDGNETLSENRTKNNMLGAMDPADIAMFYSDETDRAPGRPPGRPPGGSLPDASKPPSAHLLADKLKTSSTGQITATPLPAGVSVFHGGPESSTAIGDTPSNARDTIDPSPSAKWLGNIKPPVSPALPEYPPPVRSPTPPGLPSFGTEEARLYDFRIGVPHPIENRNVSQLRHLLRGRPPGRSPSDSNRQPRTRVFAEDGTAVLGSFPQRQSGHGSNVLSKIDDHPFHQGDLPFALSDGASTGRNDAVSEVPSLSPDSAAAEATLNWLIANQSPPSQTPPTTAPNSTLLVPGHGGKRPESYHTCVSRIFDSHSPLRAIIPGHSNLTKPCDLAPTQSATPTSPQGPDTSGRNSYNRDMNPVGHWGLLVKRGKSIFCCCWGSEEGAPETCDSSDALNPHTTNTTTQDTYVTARGQVSNESQQGRTQIIPFPENQFRP